MSLRISQRKQDKLEAAERPVRTRAEKVVQIWNARSRSLFYLTFRTAIGTGHHRLSYQCPACRQVDDIDLREQDGHPDATISVLIPRLSCGACRPHPPFARLLRLDRDAPEARKPWKRFK